ncbi:MAG TPA: zinc ribbon domain-containing protein [bacterium]|nr:zinc ribbon domain-containing protein [bacterium]
MKPCRECKKEISEQAVSCPHCGAPRPAKEKWDGWGFEYKSKSTFRGLPLLHIAFKYRPTGAPVVAKGILAVGQFACGVVTVSQFGVGLISISQFTMAGYALAQFAVGYAIIAQIGLYIHAGRGQMVRNILGLIGLM